MKKQEMITAVAEELEITKKEAGATLEGVFNVIGEALADGKKVSVGDLGKLEVRTRAARKGVNPSTGQPMDIPQTNAIAFKQGKAGKSLVN